MRVELLPSAARERRVDAGASAAPPAPLWPHAANAILGGWLATAPVTVGNYPTGMIWSDVACGLAIIVLSGLACRPRFAWAAWAVAAVGLWLMCAPLVLWATAAAAYSLSTLIGALVFALALLVPGMAGSRDLPGPDRPPGWTYNPSAWPQRAGIIALALVQFSIARYLAAYQLGYTTSVWDPFFADGTRRVLDSEVSKAFPVSDAGLGAVTYLIEALTGFLGGTRRWRSMPWAVMLFGVLIVPVGVVSIVLVVLQPVVVGAWCSLCLITAVLTVIMISPAVDEIVASGQFLLHERRQGRSLWSAFWHGGSMESSASEVHTPQRQSFLGELAGGMELNSIPWNLVLVAMLGIWLMIAPAVLGHVEIAAYNDQLVGALVITFAVIGFGEAARGARLLNLLLGAWLLAGPWVLPDVTPAARWNDMAVGAAVIVFSLRRGRVEGHFGGWDRWVF